mmetsp:Transcript_61542/g.134745  ORF Transcript_61542/g.134745 Transcript_61542/m.134745 type:complete len:217 (+) Transcript_61542:40-690(+)
MASRSLANIPKDAKKKLFFTSSQETHDGRPQSAPCDNFYSVRETKHVMERAASAPGGEKWGTSYTKAFDREPVFVDLEVNNSLAAMKKAGKPYVRAPHVGTSSYSTAFDWKGTPKPVKGRVLDCGAREALSSGVSGQLISQAGYTYAARPQQPAPQKYVPIDQLGGLASSYDFLQSSYGHSFQHSSLPRRTRKPRRQMSDPSALTSTYRMSFSRGV